MRSNLESTVERTVCRKAKSLYGVINKKVGTDGWPDRMFLIPGGRPFFIEFKRPGETPEPLQVYIHGILKMLGYQIEVHDDANTALRAIATAVEAARLSKKGR